MLGTQVHWAGRILYHITSAVKHDVWFSDLIRKTAPMVAFYETLGCLRAYSSPYPQEPLGQFQPNLAQSIIRWRKFKFVQMEDHTFSQGEIITK